ncbi:ferredoxin [Candidatus Pacearchaeota archaeon]|nr:ferredoxin [Candidatus Pacearchaeota archaeon]
MAHKIDVDKEKCIGCGACVSICPDSFEMKDGKAFATKAEVEKLTCEKDAESGCPVDAIKVN